jgi:tRNA(Ile)-lysidine synthase TilS/MesJ
MLYGAEVKTMMPKLKSTNFEGMQLIRPLYHVREEDILRWKRYNDLTFLHCACRFTENCAREEDEGTSKRLEMKKLIRKFRQTNRYIDINIFNSVKNVNLKTVIGYTDAKGRHSFLDAYEGAAPFSEDE